MRLSTCGLIVYLSLFLSPAHAATFIDRARMIDPPQKVAAIVFEDADHIQHALTDYRGRFVLLNIWASWCGPCVEEMPSLDALQKKIPSSQLIVLPLSEDRGDAVVSSFYRNHALTRLPIAIDHAGIAPSVLKIDGLPTTFLINPQGYIVMRFEGDTDWTSPEALAFLHTHINAP